MEKKINEAIEAINEYVKADEKKRASLCLVAEKEGENVTVMGGIRDHRELLRLVLANVFMRDEDNNFTLTVACALNDFLYDAGKELDIVPLKRKGNIKKTNDMTKKEELTQAVKMAVAIKSVAESLRRDARDYDVRFPIQHAERLERVADDFLKAVKP